MATTIPRRQFWMSLSLVILLLSIGQTSAKPSPWLRTIFQHGLVKVEVDSDQEKAIDGLGRGNTRQPMITWPPLQRLQVSQQQQ